MLSLFPVDPTTCALSLPTRCPPPHSTIPNDTDPVSFLDLNQIQPGMFTQLQLVGETHTPHLLLYAAFINLDLSIVFTLSIRDIRALADQCLSAGDSACAVQDSSGRIHVFDLTPLSILLFSFSFSVPPPPPPLT